MFYCSWLAVANKAYLCTQTKKNVSNISFTDTKNSTITKRINHCLTIPVVVPSSHVCACSSQCELVYLFFKCLLKNHLFKSELLFFSFSFSSNKKSWNLSSVLDFSLWKYTQFAITKIISFLNLEHLRFPLAHAVKGSPCIMCGSS